MLYIRPDKSICGLVGDKLKINKMINYIKFKMFDLSVNLSIALSTFLKIWLVFTSANVELLNHLMYSVVLFFTIILTVFKVIQKYNDWSKKRKNSNQDA